MIVEKNKVVSLSYELKVNGEMVENVSKDSPLMFLVGTGNLLPKFEQNLDGLKINDNFDFAFQGALLKDHSEDSKHYQHNRHDTNKQRE